LILSLAVTTVVNSESHGNCDSLNIKSFKKITLQEQNTVKTVIFPVNPQRNDFSDVHDLWMKKLSNNNIICVNIICL